MVDNNSTDNSKKITATFIKEFGQLNIVYAFCEEKGAAASRNKGAGIATGEWLIFADSDCVPSSSWISDYIKHFDDDTIGAVAGCIKPYSPTNLVQKTLSLFTLPENPKEIVHEDYNTTKGLYPTANLAVRKRVFNLIGGFNEDLRYAEDRELCHKIYKSGYKIKAVKNAIVEHIHRDSLSGLINQSFGFGTAHPYELKHFSSGRIIFTSSFFKINRAKPGKYVWIDLNQADKKVLILFLLGWIWWPLYSLLFVYFLHLCLFIYRRSVKIRIITKLIELPFLACLLVLKSFCLTAGRVSNSPKYGVFCL